MNFKSMACALAIVSLSAAPLFGTCSTGSCSKKKQPTQRTSIVKRSTPVVKDACGTGCGCGKKKR